MDDNRPITLGYVPPSPETHANFLIVSVPMAMFYGLTVAWAVQDLMRDHGPWVMYPLSLLAFLAVLTGHKWEWRPHGGLPWWLEWARDSE